MLLLCFSYAVQFSKNGFLEILMRGFYTSHGLSKLNSGSSPCFGYLWMYRPGVLRCGCERLEVRSLLEFAKGEFFLFSLLTSHFSLLKYAP